MIEVPIPARRLVVYQAWSRPAETAAPLGVIEDRFPTLFESRRMSYPAYTELADPALFDQGIAGFLDHVLKRNFTAFLDLAERLTGKPASRIERVADDGRLTRLDSALRDGADTLVVISFDSRRTGQMADAAEIDAIAGFLANPDHLAFICPHHDIGDADDLPHSAGEDGDADGTGQAARRLAEFRHHGDRTIPPQQRFGGFARSVLAGLGVPVDNLHGLHPAAMPDGTPAPIDITPGLDRLRLLDGVTGFNLHPHLPQLERLGAAAERLDVLARQRIDPHAPPHPFARRRGDFDALLQSRPDAFGGTLLVGDATLWSSTAGGVDSLERLWRNVLLRPRRPS